MNLSPLLNLSVIKNNFQKNISNPNCLKLKKLNSDEVCFRGNTDSKTNSLMQKIRENATFDGENEIVKCNPKKFPIKYLSRLGCGTKADLLRVAISTAEPEVAYFIYKNNYCDLTNKYIRDVVNNTMEYQLHYGRVIKLKSLITSEYLLKNSSEFLDGIVQGKVNIITRSPIHSLKKTPSEYYLVDICNKKNSEFLRNIDSQKLQALLKKNKKTAKKVYDINQEMLAYFDERKPSSPKELQNIYIEFYDKKVKERKELLQKKFAEQEELEVQKELERFRKIKASKEKIKRQKLLCKTVAWALSPKTKAIMNEIADEDEVIKEIFYKKHEFRKTREQIRKIEGTYHVDDDDDDEMPFKEIVKGLNIKTSDESEDERENDYTNDKEQFTKRMLYGKIEKFRLNDSEVTALRKYYKLCWQRIGREEHREAMKRASEIVKTYEEQGLDAIEDEVAKKAIIEWESKHNN